MNEFTRWYAKPVLTGFASQAGISMPAYTYRAKRTERLRNGLVFVEIDYLHESPPTFERLADYSAQAQAAHPYRNVVLDPRPNFHTEPVCLHEFDVDQAIPTVTIPLIGTDQLAFDFDAAYQKTFTDALYGYDLDYRQLPLNFQRYGQGENPFDEATLAELREE